MAYDYLPIMNGKRRDPIAWSVRFFLWCASIVYRLIVMRRNHQFDIGKYPCFKAGVPVISVGNLTTGGTGKTPIVCYLAGYLRARGLRVAIVSRGYGRGDADCNDEALELYDRLPDVPHLQDPDRVISAKIAVEELGAEIILMDDGFQHRHLHRDLDIVAIDATEPFGFGHCLPRGLLREPLSGLKRAGVILLTRSDQADPGRVEWIQNVVREHSGQICLVQSQHSPSGLFEIPDTVHPIEELDGAKVAALSAIGNPQAFERTLRAAGATIVSSRRLSDHNPFHPETVDELRRWVADLGEEIDQVICTHKDLVKLQMDRLGGRPVRALQVQLQVNHGEAELEERLQGVVKQIMESSEAKRLHAFDDLL